MILGLVGPSHGSRARAALQMPGVPKTHDGGTGEGSLPVSNGAGLQTPIGSDTLRRGERCGRLSNALVAP